MKTAEKSEATLKPKRTATNGRKKETKVDDHHRLSHLASPEEDQIRALAEAIYRDRLETGESGTAEDDWRRAEYLLFMVE